MAGREVRVAVEVTTQDGDLAHRVGKAIGAFAASGLGVITQDAQFGVLEQQLGRQLRGLAPEQRHEHDTPGDDHADGDSTLQALDTVVTEFVDLAAGF